MATGARWCRRRGRVGPRRVAVRVPVGGVFLRDRVIVLFRDRIVRHPTSMSETPRPDAADGTPAGTPTADLPGSPAGVRPGAPPQETPRAPTGTDGGTGGEDGGGDGTGASGGTGPGPAERPGPDGGDATPGGRRGRRRRRWLVRLGIAVVVILAVVLVADHVTMHEYAITPGQAQPVGPLLKVPADKGHRTHNDIFLTDVYVTGVNALNYLWYHLDGNAQMVSDRALLGPTTPASEMQAQGYLEMAQSHSAAKAAALSRLGYAVHERNAGTLIFAVAAGSPASKVLKVAQVVTSVDGTPTPDVCAFVAALAPKKPGSQVDLAVQQDRVTSGAVQVTGRTVHERVRLAPWPKTATPPAAPSGCPGSVPAPKAYLGVEVETQQHFSYPFPVSIQTTRIGGPSAGLAMTLGIIDSLTGGHLTGGMRVAATGTIDPQGQVGDVGGVPQKTVAVERAGATVFFVPKAERSQAQSKATPSLHVYAVTSLDQALAILHRLGGQVPPKSQAVAPAS